MAQQWRDPEVFSALTGKDELQDQSIKRVSLFSLSCKWSFSSKLRSVWGEEQLPWKLWVSNCGSGPISRAWSHCRGSWMIRRKIWSKISLRIKIYLCRKNNSCYLNARRFLRTTALRRSQAVTHCNFWPSQRKDDQTWWCLWSSLLCGTVRGSQTNLSGQWWTSYSVTAATTHVC